MTMLHAFCGHGFGAFVLGNALFFLAAREQPGLSSFPLVGQAFERPASALTKDSRGGATTATAGSSAAKGWAAPSQVLLTEEQGAVLEVLRRDYEAARTKEIDRHKPALEHAQSMIDRLAKRGTSRELTEKRKERAELRNTIAKWQHRGVPVFFGLQHGGGKIGNLKGEWYIEKIESRRQCILRYENQVTAARFTFADDSVTEGWLEGARILLPDDMLFRRPEPVEDRWKERSYEQIDPEIVRAYKADFPSTMPLTDRPLPVGRTQPTSGSP